MAITGLEDVLRQFDSFEKELQDEIKLQVEVTVKAIEIEAKRLAPGPGDSLLTTFGTQKIQNNISGSIYSELSSDGLKGTIGISGSAGLIAIYVEFGTGSSAAGYVPTLPIEFQEIAKSYYINGKGTLISQPFLLPSFFKNQELFVKELRDTLISRGYDVK
jgi:hypothetical protein